MLDVQSKRGQAHDGRQRRHLDETALDRPPFRGQPRAMSAYLKKWRTTLGFTLEQVAAKIGRHFTTVQKWEKGVNAVGMRELELLGKAYGVPAIALTLDPVDRKTAERLIRAHRILTQSTEATIDEWLRFGETMLARKLQTPRDT